MSWLFLGILASIAVAVLTLVALHKSSSKSESTIMLRIVLGYLQGIGSLRVFRAGGTKAYDSVMGWTEVISASPLSVGALQCILRLPYLVQYIATILLPLLAAGAVVAIFHAATVARALRCKAQCVDTSALKDAVATWWATKRHLSTLLIVLFLAYMPIVSASLRALDCIEPVAGVRYLRSDLRVECGVGEHAAARALAYIVLIVLGAGFPAGLVWLLASARKEQLLDPAFHATWGFMFDGYRVPSRTAVLPSPTSDASCESPGADLSDKRGLMLALPVVTGVVTPTSGAPLSKTAHEPHVSGDSCVWWEAVVLARKAGVVLLAVKVTNPYLQCVGASLWFLAAIGLQTYFSPYAKPLFNKLETASLLATLLTAVISTTLLQ